MNRIGRGGFVSGVRMGIAGAVLLAATGTLTSSADAQDLVVKSARVVQSATDPMDVRVVGVISNPSMYSTYVVSATSDAAERVELRDARKKDARVQEVEVAAYGVLALEAKGLYLKLVNPKRALRVGDRVEVVLSNEAQVKTRLSAVVSRP